MHVLCRSFFGLVVGVITGLAVAQTAVPPLRLRGVVQQVSATTLTLKERSGEVVELALPAELAVSEVYPIALADIQPGSFIGTASVPLVDGTRRAIAVTVFPESARGLGEGHRPFDLQPQSTMTNATVDQVVASATGRTLQVRYKDSAKTIVVPPEAQRLSAAY